MIQFFVLVKVEEINKAESLYNLKSKRIVKTGYSYFDYLSKKREQILHNKVKNILIALLGLKKNLISLRIIASFY